MSPVCKCPLLCRGGELLPAQLVPVIMPHPTDNIVGALTVTQILQETRPLQGGTLGEV